MSDITNGLQVYYTLNALNNSSTPNSVWDSSGQNIVGNISGTATVEPDPTFQNTLSLDGSVSVQTSQAAPAGLFTNSPAGWGITMWVKPTSFDSPSAFMGLPSILLTQTTNSQNSITSLRLGYDTTGNLIFFPTMGNRNPIGPLIGMQLNLNQWNFLAVTYDNSENFGIHLNDISVQLAEGSGTLTGTPYATYIGGVPGQSVGVIGQMSHIRLYNRQLSVEDIIAIQQDDLRPALQLFAPLNQLVNGTTPDYSGNGNSLAAYGNPGMATDPTFGSVIVLNGTSQSLAADTIQIGSNTPGTISGVTLSLFINSAAPDSYQTIYFAGPENFILTLSQSGNSNPGKLVWTTCDRNGSTNNLISETVLVANRWYAVAVSYEAGSGEKNIYVDGELDVSQTAHYGLPLGGGLGVNLCISTQTRDLASIPFNGKVSQARYYSQAIGINQILQDIGGAMVTSSAIKVITPLYFTWLDTYGQQALLISDDLSDGDAQLEMLNTTSQAISFAPITLTPGPEAYQIALGFRPGTLSSESITELTVSDPSQWLISAPQDLGTGGIWYYLVAASAITLQPMTSLSIELENVVANAFGGTRTTRLGLNYTHVTYTGNTDNLTGSQELVVNVVNAQQVDDTPELPLLATFVGSNQVLNNGTTSNTVTLRLLNLLPNQLLGEESELTLTANQSQITVVLSGYENTATDWGLNTNATLCQASVGIESVPPVSMGWSIDTPSENGYPIWHFTPQSDITLGTDDYIEITISNLKATGSASPSPVFIHITNVSDYWDSEYVLEIQKSPLVVGNTSIGVETLPGSYQLSLGSVQAGLSGDSSGNLNLYAGSQQRGQFGAGGTLSVGSTTYPGNIAVVGGSIQLNQSSSSFYPSLQFQDMNGHALMSMANNSSNIFALTTYNGNSNVQAISISQSGKVGIGPNSTSPTVPLQVKGSTSASPTVSNSGYLVVGSPSGQHLAIDGTQIIAKSSGSVASNLNLGASGQNVNINGNLYVASAQNSTLQGTVTLGSSGKNTSVNGQLYANNGLTVGGGIGLNSGSFILGSKSMTVPSGSNLSGLPIFAMTRATKSFSNQKGSAYTSSLSVTFPQSVANAQAVLSGWQLEFTGKDRPFHKAQVTVDSISISGATVTANFTMALKDDSGTYDDTYQGFIYLVFLATLNYTP